MNTTANTDEKLKLCRFINVLGELLPKTTGAN